MFESAISLVWKLIDKGQDSHTNFQELLLGNNCMRNQITGLSPFEIFHKRSPHAGQTGWSGCYDPEKLSQGLAIKDSNLTQQREKSCKLRKALIFQPADKVLMQLTEKATWTSGNKIISKTQDNSYLVETNYGNSLIRNERFLKPDLSYSGKSENGDAANSDNPISMSAEQKSQLPITSIVSGLQPAGAGGQTLAAPQRMEQN